MNPIVEKIRKLLARAAEGRGNSENEMEIALAHAARLAREHGLELSKINPDEGKRRKSDIKIVQDGVSVRAKYKQPYHDPICRVLEKVFGVECLYFGHNDPWGGGLRLTKILLIGDPEDIAIATEIYKFLEKRFPRSLTNQVKSGMLTYCAADTNGWYWGLMSGIIEANKKEEAKAPEEQRNAFALVRATKADAIAKYMKEEHGDLKTRKGRSKKFDAMAAHLGQQEGRRINLSQLG